MRIKKLIVRKTQPSEEVIREVLFNEKGLNLIVDNTSTKISESGNNVGKSTTIKIIDLCLGARSVRNLYYDPDTKSENVVVKKFLELNKVQAELILISDDERICSIKRDLYRYGKRYISNDIYTEDEFEKELKKVIFGFEDPRPTLRQLIPKFIRLSSTSEESMIKFIPNTRNDTYDTIYCFLLQIYNKTLLNKKSEIVERLSECQRAMQTLEKSESIGSLNVLEQSLDVINSDLEKLSKKRQELSYMEVYRNELNEKRKLTLKINTLQEEMGIVEFEINTIKRSIDKLKREKKNIDLETLRAIYTEAGKYIPDLQKDFGSVVDFHNTMIQNRIDFINNQLEDKESLIVEYTKELQELIDEKKRITIAVLDEGLLDELNKLNQKIEKLSLKKGEIQKSIALLEEQEEMESKLNNELIKIKEEMSEYGVNEKIRRFNIIFSAYCEALYGEQYLLTYDEKWKESKKFPVGIASLEGNVGTGKKKAVIVAFDLAYMQYSIEKAIKAPRFVIHDKMENTHINQLKTIFEICERIDGQYIIPILRERIDKVDQEYIEKAKILELSTKDKFFCI